MSQKKIKQEKKDMEQSQGNSISKGWIALMVIALALGGIYYMDRSLLKDAKTSQSEKNNSWQKQEVTAQNMNEEATANQNQPVSGDSAVIETSKGTITVDRKSTRLNSSHSSISY